MADFGGGDIDAFRSEVRAWLEANYPAELRDPKAFLPEPEKKKKGSGTSGGGEWPDLQQASSTTSYNAHAKIREGS